MGDLLQPWHLVVLGVVAFLLFGAKRLPELGKGLGEGLKGFKEGIKGVTDPTPAPPPVPCPVSGTVRVTTSVALAELPAASIAITVRTFVPSTRATVTRYRPSLP